MNYADLTAEQLIHKLNVAGRYPHPDLINAIWERRAATEPLLLTLFAESFDDNWPKHDDPRWYRFIHAGKFMLSWQNLDSLPTFARLYGSDDDDIKNWCEWFEEDLFHFGPPIIPYLEPIVRQESGNEWHYGHPDMDYVEHEKTYKFFINLFKWGTVFCIGCVVLLAVLTL